MKNQKGFIQIPLLIAIIAGVLVLSGAGYFGIKQYQNYQAKQIEEKQIIDETEKARQEKEKQAQDSILAQQKDLEQAQAEIEKLKQESAATKEKQSKLESITKIQSNTPDSTEIISLWRKSLAYIVCEWHYPSGKTYQVAAGSGRVEFLQALNPDGSRGQEFSAIGTNKHVVVNEYGYRANSCEITFPDSNKIYKMGQEAGSIMSSSNYDTASLFPNNSDSDLTARRIKTYCKKDEPKIGDEVLILGYPSIGSKSDITVTDGIISGLDGDYYITSAKIDSGNSGGIAVLKRSNCFIGMPTYVKLGDAESLGRILNNWIIK